LRTFEVFLRPGSPFGTPVKGDTLFGHFCWQAAYDEQLLRVPFDAALAAYGETPFAVFSSAFPVPASGGGRIFPRPALPGLRTCVSVGEEPSPHYHDRKKDKSNRWFLLGDGQRIAWGDVKWLNGSDLAKRVIPDGSHATWRKEQLYRTFLEPSLRHRNALDRLKGATGEAPFVPFASEDLTYAEGVRLVVYVGIDETMTSIEGVVEGIRRIGHTGFGRDASVGFGKFEVDGYTPVDLASLGNARPDAAFTLGPCVPNPGSYRESGFLPFIRFGRHGDRMALSRNPFKAPVVMADEGAVFQAAGPEVWGGRNYIGRAVKNVSKVQPEAVCQGYSLFIPVRWEA
jgi:CRISPR-associated protein Csm4